jgi:hypothetical protein
MFWKRIRLPKWLPFEKETIYGCEGRGDAASAYLTRWTFLKFASWQLCLHHFHRSDHDTLHDHPWDFLTIPLLAGYFDETAAGRERVWSLVPYYRKAEHAHRVQLLRARDLHNNVDSFRSGIDWNMEIKAWSLVLMFRRRREWGFFTKEGWTWWRTYFHNSQC